MVCSNAFVQCGLCIYAVWRGLVKKVRMGGGGEEMARGGAEAQRMGGGEVGRRVEGASCLGAVRVPCRIGGTHRDVADEARAERDERVDVRAPRRRPCADRHTHGTYNVVLSGALAAPGAKATASTSTPSCLGQAGSKAPAIRRENPVERENPFVAQGTRSKLARTCASEDRDGN